MSADPIAALCVELEAFASGRVWGGELPRTENATMPRDNIVLTPVGRVPGEGDQGYARLGRIRVDVRCYGADSHGAFNLWASVHDALKAMRGHVVELDAGDVLLHNATISAGPFALHEPDTDWPFALGVYGVSYSEQLVS